MDRFYNPVNVKSLSRYRQRGEGPNVNTSESVWLSVIKRAISATISGLSMFMFSGREIASFYL